MLDLQTINERFEDHNLHITIYPNNEGSWYYLLGAGGDVGIADLIYGLSLMVIKGKRVKQLDRFVVVDYDNHKVFTIQNEEALVEYYMSVMTERKYAEAN